jgi:hypothetical protein
MCRFRSRFWSRFSNYENELLKVREKRETPRNVSETPQEFLQVISPPKLIRSHFSPRLWCQQFRETTPETTSETTSETTLETTPETSKRITLTDPIVTSIDFQPNTTCIGSISMLCFRRLTTDSQDNNVIAQQKSAWKLSIWPPPQALFRLMD